MNARELSVLAALLALVFSACLFGCGDDDDDNDDSENGDDDDDDLWQPSPGTSWQLQFVDDIDTSFDVDMYDIDLFDTDVKTIEQLRDDGRIVICYFSAGSYEDWRDDAADFPEEALGADLENWEGERWLDITNEQVREIMTDRMDLAVEKGCDGVDPDNVNGYANENGLGLTADDQLDYNIFIAEKAHDRGLSVGLKNDLGQLEELVDYYDWALNEACHVYEECDMYSPFIDAGKAIFNVEYVDDWADAQDLADDICGSTPELDTIIKEWELTAKRVACSE